MKIHLKDEYSENVLETGGLNIHTTFDLFLQKSIRDTLSNTLSRLGERFPLSKNAQATVVVIKPQTGELLSHNWDVVKGNGKFNRAVYSKRQIGSMIKPFIYSMALDTPENFNLLTEINDADIAWKLSDGSIWEPSNYNENQRTCYFDRWSSALS